MNQQKQIDAYIREVCSHIKRTDVHESIALELKGHLEEKIEQYQSEGMSEEQAVDQAIADMGSPVTLGKQLHYAHKPRMEWSILAILAGLISCGLLVMHGLGTAQSGNALLTSKLWGILAGTAAFTVMLFADYRKGKRYSKHLYAGTVLLMLATHALGTTMNGKPYLDLGFLTLDLLGIASIPLVIALAGMFADWDWKRQRTIWIAFAAFALPFLLLAGGSAPFSAVLFFAAFVLLVVLSPAQKRVALATVGLTVVFTIAFVALTIKPYQIERLHLGTPADPSGSGYTISQSLQVMHSASLFGSGSDATLPAIPALESDFVFTYVVHQYGLAAGTAILCLGIVLLLRLVRAARQVRRDTYGFMLMTGLMTLFFLPYFWSILMTVGLVPLISVNLPLISHGNAQVILYMGLFGLMLTIYRHKDVPTCQPQPK